MEIKEWDKRDMSPEEVRKKIASLEEQILAFELNVRLEEKTIAFRDVYMAWYDSRLTLEAILQAVMDRKLNRPIHVFSRD